MVFDLQFNFITGVMVGIEFVNDEDGDSGGKHMAIDLFIIRFLFSIYPSEE